MPDRPPQRLEPLADQPVRLIVADIDGCLSGGAGFPFDGELLRTLQWANTASRHDPAIPAVTLCTGRPQPYVECLLQAISGYQPALCENGTVCFDPATHSILTHPDFGPDEAEALAELNRIIAHEFPMPNINPEPGKITHLTVIIQPPHTPEQLYDQAVQIASRFGDTFVVELTSICVHFLFRHLDKGTGLNWLSEHTGIPPTQMAGIGDANPDLSFLRRVAYAYAPANANTTVKDSCHAVSEQNDGHAMMELLHQAIAHNNHLKEQGLLNPQQVPAQ